MQNIVTLETNKYSIKLENFEGPLDLLCHLIDKNKMDIYHRFKWNHRAIYRLYKTNGATKFRDNKWIFSNVINIVIFKIKTFIAKSSRRGRRDYRRRANKKNNWI